MKLLFHDIIVLCSLLRTLVYSFPLSPLCKRDIRLRLSSKDSNQYQDDLESLKLDVTKLGQVEQERLLFINKLTKEGHLIITESFSRSISFLLALILFDSSR